MPLQRFQKRPLVIQAVQWDETIGTFVELEAAGLRWSRHTGHASQPDYRGNLRIITLEGPVNVQKGDWIIRGIAGEWYPCADSLFRDSFDLAP